MSFTKREWQEAKQRLAARQEVDRVQDYRAMAQSEVAASQLTTSPAWNWFLQILAATKRNSETALAELDAQARISEDFSHEGLAHVQALRRAWHARIVTLEEVVDLPSQIIGDSRKAKEKLEALNHAEAHEKTDGPAAS